MNLRQMFLHGKFLNGCGVSAENLQFLTFTKLENLQSHASYRRKCEE